MTYKKYLLVPHTDSRKFRVYTPDMIMLGDFASEWKAKMNITMHIKAKTRGVVLEESIAE
tara:strand:- start:1163 stop:1342 length:180 start_codon:yes stop_codon:yes gene_type:complete